MKLFKNINSTDYALYFSFLAPALYFILGVIFTNLNWNPVWILITAVLNTIINWFIMYSLDNKRNNK